MNELVAELNASYGLDKPVLEGYFSWLSKAVKGNLENPGSSISR